MVVLYNINQDAAQDSLVTDLKCSGGYPVSKASIRCHSRFGEGLGKVQLDWWVPGSLVCCHAGSPINLSPVSCFRSFYSCISCSPVWRQEKSAYFVVHSRLVVAFFFSSPIEQHVVSRMECHFTYGNDIINQNKIFWSRY